MVNQLLFGDLIHISEVKDKWTYIRSVYDDYEGWIDSKQYLPLTREHFQALYTADPAMSEEYSYTIENKTHNTQYPIVLGSTLPGLVAQSFLAANQIFRFTGRWIFPEKPSPENISLHAKRYLETPYLWGGKTPFGIDCSGLTQMVYKLCGMKLPRDAWQQAELGTTLSFLEESKPGDLAFFDNKDGKVVHVGILLEKDKIIHAGPKVRIDTIDHEGIFNAESGGYTHHLRVLKRYVSQ